MSQCTEDKFLRDIAEHKMTVIRADGVNRHLRFQKPGSMCMHFDLITWPGYLCYTGDMGTYVFRRLNDMFEFFRTDRENMKLRDGRTLAINPSYWGEKLEAIDHCDGFREWRSEVFEARIREAFDEWLNENNASDETRAEATEQFEDEVIAEIEVGKGEAYRAACEFEVNGDTPFQDWWEVNTDEYTYRFMWCCFALAWGIQQYDLSAAEIAGQPA